MAFWSKKDKIAIVGAGPVGMVLANLLYEAGHRDITIFEKRKKYTRQQIVFLNSNVTNYAVPKVVIDKIIKSSGCHETSISFIAQPLCYTEPENIFTGVSVQLSTFENIMYKYLRKLSGSIKWVQDVYKDTGFKRIIGADGPNSMIRSEFFPKNTLVKYTVRNRQWYGFLTFFKLPKSMVKKWIIDPKKINLYKLPVFNSGQDRSRIFVQKDGTLVLNLLLAKEELGDRDKIRKWALTINSVSWDKVKKYQYDETLFPMNFYYSKKFVERINGKYYYLVGDAAFNVNFFSGAGVNNGIQSAIYLLLSKNISDYSKLMSGLRAEVRFITEVGIDSDFDRIMKNCEKYSKTELKKLLNKGSIPMKNMEGLDKRELCIYAGRLTIGNYVRDIVLNNPYFKKARSKNKYIFIDRFLYDVFHKYICDSAEIPNELKVLFERFDTFSEKDINQVLSYINQYEYKEYIKKLKDGTIVTEPNNNSGWDYGAYWGYKYWTAGYKDTPSWILNNLKDNSTRYKLCKMLIRYQKNKTMTNFIQIFMFAALSIPEFKVQKLS